MVGTALEAASFHPGRTARNHLAVYAAAAGLPRARVTTVLETVGLGAYGDRRVGGYSLGMRQRLGLAMALLGDPRVLVLDEPVNGLDPEGIRWIRTFLRELAAEGRTVLVSSHLLSEVQQSVDRLVVITKGKLVYEGDLAGLETDSRVIADSPDRGMLDAALLAAGAEIQSSEAGVIVSSLSAAEVGAIAHRAGVQLSLLHTQQGGLEKAFLDLVGEGRQP
jgi:ABC-2 type transport system ATP-binding protein